MITTLYAFYQEHRCCGGELAGDVERESRLDDVLMWRSAGARLRLRLDSRQPSPPRCPCG
jgi:hypothetical protein